MTVFYQLTRNTFRECLREPVFFLVLASALLLIASFPVLTIFAFHRQLWTVLESSMAAVLFLGFVAAVLCSNACIRREMQGGTMLLLLSKPVSRFVFVLAKITGIIGAMLVFAFITCTAAALITITSLQSFQIDIRLLLYFFGTCAVCAAAGAVRNYLHGASFSETFILSMLLALPVLYGIYYRFTFSWLDSADPHEVARMTIVTFTELLPVLSLLILAIVLMGIIAAALALRLSFMSNLLICALVFLGGLTVGPWVKNVFGENSLAAGIIGALIPNWQHFWMAYPVTADQTVPVSYLAWMLFYVIVYGMLWVIWAAVSFQGTEIAKDSRS